MNMSQSVARSGSTNLKLYKKSITKAKTAPKRSAGSTIILIMSYASSRASGSKRLTVTKAAVIGIITINSPANKLVKKFDKDGVINSKSKIIVYLLKI